MALRIHSRRRRWARVGHCLVPSGARPACRAFWANCKDCGDATEQGNYSLAWNAYLSRYPGSDGNIFCVGLRGVFLFYVVLSVSRSGARLQHSDRRDLYGNALFNSVRCGTIWGMALGSNNPRLWCPARPLPTWSDVFSVGGFVHLCWCLCSGCPSGCCVLLPRRGPVFCID